MFGIDDAALVMGGAQLLGGAMGADAAEDAAAAQGQASAASIGEQRRQFDIGRKDSAPYREVGGSAVRRISDLLGLGNRPNVQMSGRPVDQIQAEIRALEMQRDANKDMYGDADPVFDNRIRDLSGEMDQLNGGGQGWGSLNNKFTVGDFYKDPVTELGMKYGLDLGARGINQGAAAGGMKRSGQTLKALTQFGTDYAGTKAGESQSRFYGDQDRIYNRLAGVSGVGQTAMQNQNQIGAQFAGNIGNTMTAQGNARGAAGIAKSNAWNNSFTNIGQWWNQDQMMNKFSAMRGGGLPGIADETRIS